jgi:hypothetical protein
MFERVVNLLTYLRGCWRWARGRCPLCNRNLYAVFSYYMAAYPNCPVCKNENETDLHLWHKYRTLEVEKELGLIRIVD